MSERVLLRPRGPFGVDAVAEHLANFPPACHDGMDRDGWLRVAFVADDFTASVGVALRAAAGGVELSLSAPEVGAARAQAERIFGLDVDATPLAATARRDPVARRVIDGVSGLRHVLFSSPYEAAAWSILANRVHVRQAAAMKRRLVAELGDDVTIEGRTLRAFPRPERLLRLEGVGGLAKEQLVRLRGVAEAALAGGLDPAQLRALPPDDALRRLRTIRGLGQFYAALVYVRASGVTDYLPTGAPRVSRAVAALWGRKSVDDDALAEIAEPWRPLRTWMTFLATVFHGKTTRPSRRPSTAPM